MSLIYTTGFDHDAYAYQLTSSNASIASPGRFGRGRYIRISNGNGHLTHSLSATNQHNSYFFGYAARDATVPYTDLSFGGLLKLFGDTGQLHVAVYFSLASPGQFRVRACRGTTANVLGESDVIDLQNGSWHYWEFKVTIDDTNGEVMVRRDGVTILNVSGVDTRNSGANTNAYTLQFPNNSENNTSSYDDLYIIKNDNVGLSNFLGEIEVEALLPNGNGNYSDLVGSDGNSTDNYLLVDDSPTVNDTDFVGSAVDGAKDTYTFGNLARPSSVVRALQVSFRSRKSDTGSKSVRRILRSNNTDHTGDDINLASSYTWNQEILEKNPLTTNDWTQSDVDNLEAGVEVRP